MADQVWHVSDLTLCPVSLLSLMEGEISTLEKFCWLGPYYIVQHAIHSGRMELANLIQ